jgi:hypothetical protein
MALNSQNRLRHRDVILLLMTQPLIIKKLMGPPHTNTDTFRVSEWPWGELGNRLGSRRSRDGIIFDLPKSPMRLSNNNKVVAKFIFSDSDAPRLESEISYYMGVHRIGPTIYAAYETKINLGLWAMQLSRTPSLLKYGKINLFQDWNNRPLENKGFTKLFIIIMENLYFNPHKGVIEGATINDVIKNRLPWTIPYRQLRDKINKMHELGVVHGDMHTDNIVVQKIRSSNGIKYGVRIIDFGVSLMTADRLSSNRNANRVLERLPGAYRGINPASNTPNDRREYVTPTSNLMPRLRNSEAWARIQRMSANSRMNRNPGSARANYSREQEQNVIAREIRSRYNTTPGRPLNMSELNEFLRNRNAPVPMELPNYESPSLSQRARRAALESQERRRREKLVPFPTYTSENLRRSP